MSKHALHSYLSDEANEGWNTTTADCFVSKSGVLEAIGLRFYNGDTLDDFTHEQLMKEAAAIDHERRNRKGKAVPA